MANQIGAPFAGFLSADDYSAGQRASNADVNNKIAQASNAYDLGVRVMDRQAAKAQQAEQRKQLEMGQAVEEAKWGAAQAPQEAPQQASPAPQVPSAQVPASSAPTVQSSPMPAQMPSIQPAVQYAPTQSAPVAAAKSSQPETLSTVVTPASTAPIVQVAQPAATMIQSPAPATVAQAPATVAAPTDAGEAVRAKLKTVTTEAASKDQAILQQLVQTGKITPDFAQRYATNAAAIREKAADRVIETETKLAAIVDKDLDAKKKRVEIAKTIRDAEDNTYNDIYTAFSNGGVQAAKMTAKELGIEIDLANPKELAKLETRAQRSSDYKEIQARQIAQAKEVREEAKSEREDSRVVREDARSAREDARLELERRKVEAAESKTRRNPSVQPDGRVSIVKEDSQGNRMIPKDVVNEIQQVDGNARLADSLLKTTEALVADDYKVVKAAPSSTVGNLISDAASLTDATKGSATKARETIERATELALPMLASIDPRAKGAPSNADIAGIKKIFTNPNASAEEKIAAIETVRGWASIMQKQRETSFNSIDDESRSLLKPYGIDAGGSADKPVSAPQKTFTLATVQEAAKRSGKSETQIIKALEAAGGKLVSK